jgi:hypothetical protein
MRDRFGVGITRIMLNTEDYHLQTDTDLGCGKPCAV